MIGRMSTLLEIEHAVSSLPAPQQHSLLLWLQGVVRLPEKRSQVPASARQDWLRRCASRREQGRTGHAGTPLQEIMDDLRGN